MVDFPRYKCHKEVKAIKLGRVVYGESGAMLYPDNPNYEPFSVDYLFVAKHNPSSGGYYVIYDDDYRSFSPAKAFEEGYTLIGEGD